MAERTEALLRIVVCLVSGLILSIWKALIQLVVLVNWIMTIVSGKRSKGLAEFCEIWNTQIYVFLRYVTMVNNKRPFPFRKIEKNISKFGK